MQIILTNHAKERLRKRRMSLLGIEQTILTPDYVKEQDRQVKKFIKQQGTRRYEVVATYKPRQQAWLVLSVWVRGEEDRPAWGWRLLSLPFKLVGWGWRRLWRQ